MSTTVAEPGNQDQPSSQSVVIDVTESFSRRLSREICAPLFWFYVFVKLFIFDLDIYLATRFFPGEAWLLSLKSLCFIGFLAIAWFLGGTRSFLIWIAYVIFYPAILIVWKLPRFLWRQESWNLIFATVNALLSFFTSLKRTLTTLAVFLFAVASAVLSSNTYLLYAAIVALLLVLASVYVHRFILAFQPSSVFLLWTEVFAGAGKHLSSTPISLDRELQDLSVTEMGEPQLQQWANAVQVSILFNRVCLFTARKLRDYQNSGLNPSAYLLSCILLIFITVASFAAINYAIYKMDHQTFHLSADPTVFLFFYYSFEVFLFRSVPQIEPTRAISEAASMAEAFFAFCLVVIIISLFFGVRNQRATETLNSTIEVIRTQGEDIETMIQQRFHLTVRDAIGQLKKTKVGFMAMILYFTSGIE